MRAWLQKTANAIGGSLFLTLFVVFLVQIAARFGFGKPLPWTDEAAVVPVSYTHLTLPTKRIV